MLTREESERLTRVGPGTPGGDLLRRYWYPIAFGPDLSEEQPTHFVRILGEDLILFRDKSGRLGLIQDHCPHRGASLLYGRVEERGIACAYHGWLYDVQGNCLEAPAEPAFRPDGSGRPDESGRWTDSGGRDPTASTGSEAQFEAYGSLLHLTVKAKAYPVKKRAGLYWAYLGPEPVPALPNYDILVRRDGKLTVQLRGQVDCNYFQAMENSVDPAHLQILHQETAGRGQAPTSTTRGFTDDVVSFDFYQTGYGIMKKRTYQDGRVDEHPLIFPNILRQGNGMEIRVPRDDTHTWIFEIRFWPLEEGELFDESYEPEVVPADPHKDPMGRMHPFARHRMDRVDAQDYMAWETQGPMANREVERLTTSDRGVVLLRDLMRAEIEKVQRGEDPLGVIRDLDHPMIDTNLTGSLIVEMGMFPASTAQSKSW